MKREPRQGDRTERLLIAALVLVTAVLVVAVLAGLFGA